MKTIIIIIATTILSLYFIISAIGFFSRFQPEEVPSHEQSTSNYSNKKKSPKNGHSTKKDNTPKRKEQLAGA